MKGLNFATAEEVNEMAKENVRLKQSNNKLKKQLEAKDEKNAKLKKFEKLYSRIWKDLKKLTEKMDEILKASGTK